ncbi:MAG: hypothetical protein GY806_07345 [Gammaproteobacteria bacterium]|nr:hypothetical protein [Gammaproteobacteria bacterium]
MSGRIVLIVLILLFDSSKAILSVEFTIEQKKLIASFGPWPPERVVDTSNWLSGNSTAIRFGEFLFQDHGLGGETKLSCASCHNPGKAYTDGRAVGVGKSVLVRNTPGLHNLASNRWFGWGGESDSLWAQSIRPILSPDEMSMSAELIQQYLGSTNHLKGRYGEIFGQNPLKQPAEIVLVNLAKVLAAFQESLVTSRTAFDDFRDALVKDNKTAMASYPVKAKLGLKLFIDKGRCFFCHQGPLFTNREFADIGIRFFIEGGVDPGRHAGIKQARRSVFNRMGQYNDGDPDQNAQAVKRVRLQHRNWGEFKVPGLRSVSETAPYMHNGSLPDLHAVVQHYSELDEERLHSDGEKILKPLNLSEIEVEALVEFLNSLSPQYLN